MADEKPFDPYRAIALHGLLGLVVCALWTAALVLAPLSSVVAIGVGAAIVLVGLPLALGWLPVMLGWASARTVLRLHALCFITLAVGGATAVIVAVTRHLSFSFTPGIVTGLFVWGVRTWGRASGWSDEAMTRATWRAAIGAGLVDAGITVLAFEAVVRLMVAR